MRFRRFACGCLAAGVLASIAGSALLSRAVHQRGSWGVWQRSRINLPPRVISMASASGCLFAGTEEAGVFRSCDGAGSWDGVSRGLTDPQIFGLGVDRDSGEILATTAGGLFRTPFSRESWGSWKKVADRRLKADLFAAVVPLRDPDGRRVLLAAFDEDLFRSTDGGEQWVQLPPVLDETPRALMAAAEGGEAFLLGRDRLLRSDDGGLSWARVESLPEPDAELDALAVGHGPRPALAITSFGPKLYLGRDGGRRWSEVALPAGPLSSVTIDGDRILGLRTRARGTPERYEIYETAYRLPADGSRDGTPVEVGRLGAGARVLAADPRRGGVIYAGTTSGVAVSEDSGATWTRRNAGLEDVFAFRALARLGDRLFVTTDHLAMLASDDAGRTWRPIGRRGRRWQSLAARSSNPCQLLRSGHGEAQRSTDCGATWTRLQGRAPTRLAGGADSSVVYGVERHRAILRSEDFGGSWRTILEGRVTRIAVDPHDPDHLHVAGSELRLGDAAGSVLAESRDGGRSWRHRELPFEAWRLRVLVATADGDLLAGTDQGAWCYRRGLGIWEHFFQRPVAVTDLLQDPRRPERLYLCSASALFGSEDGGESWTDLHGPINCRKLVLVDGGSTLLILTDTQSVRLERRSGWRVALWAFRQALRHPREADEES